HRPPRRQRSGESAAAVHVRTTHGEPDAPCCCPPSSPSRTAWVPPPDVHLDGSTTPVGASVPYSVAPRRLGGRGALGPLRPPTARSEERRVGKEWRCGGAPRDGPET